MFYKGPRPIKYDGNILMAINGLYNGRYYSRSILGTANYGGVYYVNGDPATGVYNGNYYVNGVFGTGYSNNVYYLSGTSTSESNLPATISGLNLWLDGADNTTILSTVTSNTDYAWNGGPVRRWLDKSGLGNHVQNATMGNSDGVGTECRYDTGILNGRSVVTFPTRFAAKSLDGDSYSAFNFLHQGYTTSEVYCLFLSNTQQQYSGFTMVYTGNRPGMSVQYQANPQPNNPQFFSVVTNSSNQYVTNKAGYNYPDAYNNFALYHLKTNLSNSPGNRTSYYINNTSGGGTDPRTGAPSNDSNANSVLKIGNSLNNYGDAKYAEVLIYNRELGTEERTAVYNYFKTKWGLSYSV